MLQTHRQTDRQAGASGRYQLPRVSLSFHPSRIQKGCMLSLVSRVPNGLLLIFNFSCLGLAWGDTQYRWGFLGWIQIKITVSMLRGDSARCLFNLLDFCSIRWRKCLCDNYKFKNRTDNDIFVGFVVCIFILLQFEI